MNQYSTNMHEGFIMTISNRNVIVARFRKLFSGLIIFLIAISFAACAKENDMVLELKDILNFKVQQDADTSTVTLNLSGHVFHSSLAIKKITTVPYNESLQVMVYLTLVRGNITGILDYSFDVPASINTVSFGNNKSVIWTRDKGIVPSK